MTARKQKVQDIVGPLDGSDGNIITEGFLMAENLNEYFSSVFTSARGYVRRERVRQFRTINCNLKHSNKENKGYEV